MSVAPLSRRLGLTGGIGSGKSTVAACLVDLGAILVDTDAIARAITGPKGLAIPHVIAAFGAEVIDAQGALDRARMRELIFTDALSKRRLEAILHPIIGQEAMAQAAAAAEQVVVFDVPLLGESSPWRARCDRILVVDCDPQTQVARVMARSGWPEAQVRSVMDQQIPRERRRAIADAVIYNDGLNLADLASEVAAIWAHWSGVAGR